MKRIGLFLLTNLAVMAVIAISFRVLGLDTAMQQGGGLNLGALLSMSAIIGFAGSLVSLVMSKWSALRMVGARVIEQPSSPAERWLVDTVRRQADRAGIGMPDVAIFDIKLARGNGIDALAAAKSELPGLRGIVLSNHATPQHVKASAEAGAEFFLDKSAEFERIGDILAAIETA